MTKNGTDPLLSAEDNTANLVEPPSDIEVNHAITARMSNLLAVVRIFLIPTMYDTLTIRR